MIHITPLVFNASGRGDTHTHTHMHARTHTHTDAQTKAILRNQVRDGLQPARAWFNKKQSCFMLLSIRQWAGMEAMQWCIISLPVIISRCL